MQKKELAQLLGISAPMVTKLSKRGMPTDTVERAARWRKRHLEPGRIKGVRFDGGIKIQTNQVTAKIKTKPIDISEAIKDVGEQLDFLLQVNEHEAASDAVSQIRALFRQTSDEAEPRLSLRVWRHLTEYVLNVDKENMQDSQHQGDLLKPIEFGFLWQGIDSQVIHLDVLNFARDWKNYSVNGWPEYDE